MGNLRFGGHELEIIDMEPEHIYTDAGRDRKGVLKRRLLRTIRVFRVKGDVRHLALDLTENHLLEIGGAKLGQFYVAKSKDGIITLIEV